MIALLGLLFVTQTFHEHATLKGHSSIVSSVSFSADSDLLATGGSGSDRTVKIWDVSEPRERATLKGHDDAILAVKFSAKDASLISVDSRAKMILWVPADGVYKSGKSQVLEGVGEIFDFDKQQFGELAIISSIKYKFDKVHNANDPYWNFSIFNVRSPKKIKTIQHDSFITSISISTDGSLVSFGDNEGVIRVLSRDDHDHLVEVRSFTCPLDEEGTHGVVTAIAFHPQNKFVAFGCASDNSIRLWRWSDAAPYATLLGHTKSVDSIAISSDGSFLVSASLDRRIKVWSLPTQKTLQTIRSDSYISSIAISHNGKYIAWGDHDHNAKIFAVDR